eukprot:Tamp_30299.p3 GENE.Tamp_30299~~Tamp_30299.p3  ORF type:complete len:126 (-),score=16.88 Tamp_30299:302-679(-)
MASLEDAYTSLAQHGLHATRAAVTELVLQDSDKQTLVRAILADISSGLAVAHPGDSCQVRRRQGERRAGAERRRAEAEAARVRAGVRTGSSGASAARAGGRKPGKAPGRNGSGRRGSRRPWRNRR